MAKVKKYINKKNKNIKGVLKNICEINGWHSKMKTTRSQIKNKRYDCFDYIKNSNKFEISLKKFNWRANIYFRKRLNQFDKKMENNINCYFTIRLK